MPQLHHFHQWHRIHPMTKAHGYQLDYRTHICLYSWNACEALELLIIQLEFHYYFAFFFMIFYKKYRLLHIIIPFNSNTDIYNMILFIFNFYRLTSQRFHTLLNKQVQYTIFSLLSPCLYPMRLRIFIV